MGENKHGEGKWNKKAIMAKVGWICACFVVSLLPSIIRQMAKKAMSLFKIFLAVLFCSYYAGNAFFVHTHLFNKCSTTHSHPYLPGANHTHAESEYVIISAFNAMQTIDPGIGTFTPSPLSFLQMIIAMPCVLASFLGMANRLTLRAPPLFGIVGHEEKTV